MIEFKMPIWLNAGLVSVMNLEQLFRCIRVRFRVDGSILFVERIF